MVKSADVGKLNEQHTLKSADKNLLEEKKKKSLALTPKVQERLGV